MNCTTQDNEAPPPSTSQAFQPDPPQHAIFVKLEIPTLVAIGQGSVILANLIYKTICCALREKRLLRVDLPGGENKNCDKGAGGVCALGTQSLGIFEVTDLRAGLETIRDELASLEAVQFSEIGYMDHRTTTWRGWQPPEAESPFQANLDLLMAWSARCGNKPPP